MAHMCGFCLLGIEADKPKPVFFFVPSLKKNQPRPLPPAKAKKKKGMRTSVLFQTEVKKQVESSRPARGRNGHRGMVTSKPSAPGLLRGGPLKRALGFVWK